MKRQLGATQLKQNTKMVMHKASECMSCKYEQHMTTAHDNHLLDHVHQVGSILKIGLANPAVQKLRDTL